MTAGPPGQSTRTSGEVVIRALSSVTQSGYIKNGNILFRIDNEDDAYRIWIGGYSGNASDSLSAHNGYKFSTVDRNNDLAPKCCPCAPAYGGGWWFYR